MQGPNRLLTNSVDITPGTPVHAGRAVSIAATTAGIQKLKLASGNILSVPVPVGLTFLHNLSVVDAPTSGTTAVATVSVLS